MATGEQRPAALVTGAAGGIGRAICTALGRAGFDIVANDIDEGALTATVAEVEATGAACASLTADIAEVEAHADLAARAAAAFGPLDCLVNNAGISVAHRGDMLEVTPESFDRLVAVNLRAPFFLTQAVAAQMLEHEAGRAAARTIVTISSANAVAVSPDRAEYCLSKTALSMMNKLYAVRLAATDIRAYEVRPGVIRTAMTEVARDRYDARYATGDFTPINRWGQPADVGRAVALLAGGEFSFSTGDVVNADGGLHIARI